MGPLWSEAIFSAQSIYREVYALSQKKTQTMSDSFWRSEPSMHGSVKSYGPRVLQPVKINIQNAWVLSFRYKYLIKWNFKW